MAAQFVAQESFRFSEAPGWQLTQGNAFPGPRLTADSFALSQDPEVDGFALDTPGQGWLRLATRTGNQANSAWLDSPIPSAGNNVKVGFDFTFWDRSGGTGADGITFFLSDATVDLTPGGFGGSLGYANRDAIDGLTGGYLGLGLDVFGNYSNPTENRNGGVGQRPGEVVLRGPGSGNTGYEYLAGTDGTNTTLPGNPALDNLETILGVSGNGLAYPGQNFRPDQDAEQYRYFEVELTEDDELIVRMRAGFDGPLVEVFTADVSAYERPELLRIGFTAGTGGVDQVYEIRNLQVSTTGATNTWYWTNVDPTPWSENSNWSPTSQPIDHAEIVFSDQFPDTNAPMTVVVDGSDKTVRHVFFGGQHAYTIQPDSDQKWIFDSDGKGDSYLSVLKTPTGAADHSIQVDFELENDLRVQHFTNRSLSLGGDIAMQGNDLFLNSFGTLEASGDISGSGDLTAQGSGLKILSGNNTYTGATVVEGGILQAASDNALGGSGSGTTVESGATLGLAGNINIANEALSLAGDGRLGLGALRNMEGTNTYGGAVTQSTASTIGADSGSTLTMTGGINANNHALSLRPEAGGTLVVDSVISGSGYDQNPLFHTGAGTSILRANNTYSGATTVSAGTLQIEHAGALGPGSLGTTVESGGTLALGNNIALGYHELRLNGAGAAGKAALWNEFGNNSVANDITLQGNASMGAASGTTLTLSQGIADGGGHALAITGAGTVQANNNLTNVSALNVNAGTLTLSGNVTPSAPAVTIATGATVRSQTSANTFGSLAGGGNLELSNSLAWPVLTFGGNGADTTFSGTVSGISQMTKVGSGTTTFSGNNTLTGTLNINSGTVALGADNVFADSMGLTLNGGTFRTAGFADQLGLLNLTSSSNLDFQNEPGGYLTFDDMTRSGGLLTIDNWSGDLSGNGDNRLQVLDNSLGSFGNGPGPLNNINFSDWGDAELIDLGGGTYEIVPTLAGFNEWSAGHPGGGGQKNDWDRDQNWTGPDPPDDAGDRALIRNLDPNLNNRTIELDGDRTVGILAIANTTGANFTIGDGELIFDNDGNGANLTLIGNSSPSINANVLLDDDLRISQNSSGTLTFGGNRLETDGNDIEVVGEGLTIINNRITEGGSLTMDATGTLRLTNNNNTYSGGTTLNDGTLQIGSNSALGSGTFDINGGAIQAFGAARSIGNSFNINDDYAVIGSENLTFSGSGTVTAGNHAVDIATGLTHSLTGSVSGTGGLTTTGDGTLAFTGGSKTFSGGLTVDSGTVNASRGGDITLGTADGANNVAGAGAITVNAGGSFNLTQSGNNAITLRGESLINDGGTIVIDSSGNNAARDFLIGSGTSDPGQLVNLGGSTTVNVGDDIRLRAGSSIEVSGGSLNLNAADAFITEGTSSNRANIDVSGDGSLTIDITGARSDENTIRLGQHDVMTVDGADASATLIGQADSAIDIDGRINLFNSGRVTVEQGSTTISSTAIVDGGNAATAGTLEVRGDIVLAGDAGITNAPNLSFNTPNDISLSGTAAGTSTKGWGTITQEGPGTTIIDDSINNIDANQIVINGGTLMLGSDDQIANTTNMVLAGGTFNTNNYNEILGTLTLTADSVIDFGDIAADGSILKFADSSGESWNPNATLTVINWNGNFATGDGIDQLFFGTNGNGLTEQQRSQIVFADYPGDSVIHLPDGEVVPVPEPAAVAAGFGLAALIAWRERRRIKRIWELTRERISQ